MPVKANPYSEKNVADFLRDNFRDNATMRYRLANIIAGVREQAYQEGMKARKCSSTIVENIIL